ncbi:ATP-dependent Clp protease adapter ClpS [Arachnia propionica]|uniref:ATP-dependent Clp protease adapter protein ClpS n=1 Tax=Arachnia propionica TaxID=1750 RepID=A0A3P1WPI9_9ACTN|nr:ATP-dependent Clp protease adapter ClpS [Arachnia propionica]RRD48502.1 ATP-dependent Clp protease adapter ClpS [Arachnia propionica]
MEIVSSENQWASLEQPEGGVATLEEPVAEQTGAWVTIVWDDPVNLMDYVTHVFCEYFGYPRAKAEELMLRVHHEGRAVVSSGNKEAMERDVMAMQDYTLWATMEQM